MEWSEAAMTFVKALKPVEKNPPLITRILSLVDLTSLNEQDTPAEIGQLCEQAQTDYGHVAAVCVYPKFVSLVATQLTGTPIKVATVVNFPDGDTALEKVLIEINDALEDGAQEIDAVFPYKQYVSGDRHYALKFVETCKAACGSHATLKVILETGLLGKADCIADACYEVFAAGADFVKTSTGKVPTGATLEAAATLLLVIRNVQPRLQRPLGLKVAGGIKTLQEAAQYVELADIIMGKGWVTPASFRIGSSNLVHEIMRELA